MVDENPRAPKGFTKSGIDSMVIKLKKIPIIYIANLKQKTEKKQKQQNNDVITTKS